MKVLHVNALDISGGAAKAAHRLHQALLERGIDSQMLVLEKKSDEYTIIGPRNKLQSVVNELRPYIDYLPLKLYQERAKRAFSPSWLPFSGIVDNINSLNPNIVHLHWIAGGMMTIEEIAKIKAPIVWSLHDNWAFTGGCHVMWDCEKYMESCGACPLLGSLKENDLSRKVYLRKKKTYSSIDITYIGLSNWMTAHAKKSTLLSSKNIECIPSPIDTDLYKPVEKEIAREILGLPLHQKLIGFGAVNPTSDINKGFQELTKSLNILEKDNIELVVFGSGNPRYNDTIKLPAHFVGFLKDDITLKLLYSAVDLVVVPSRQENLSNVIMEAQSCGTPVVAFDIGGNNDIIEHKVGGYLAKPFNAFDLANGVKYVLSANNSNQLGINARDKILSTFDSSLISKQYLSLYQRILSGE